MRTLMNSSAAICASVRPWATRVTSSRSRALSFPGPDGWGCCGLGIGKHECVLGRGVQAHRRAALFGGPGPARSERLPGPPERPLPAAYLIGRVLGLLAPRERGVHGPHRDGLGGPPGRRAQQPAAVQGIGELSPLAGARVDLDRFPQVRRGVWETACLQVQDHQLCQQDGLVLQVPTSRAWARAAAQTVSAAARSWASISAQART